MASRTLLQLLTLSIIFTNLIEARTFNNTHDLEKNKEYDTISTSVNKSSDKANESGRNNTALMKKIYTHTDLLSNKKAESRHDTLSKYKYDESMAKTTAMEIVKQEGTTKLDPNEESSIQNYVKKKNHLTAKPVRRQKHLTVGHRNTNIRTTQANREKQLISKITDKRDTEVENKIYKPKHCDCKNHKSFEKISREHDVYKLKRRDESKTASKHNNKKKVNKNNMKVKHRFIKSHRTFNPQTLPQENSVYVIEQKPILSKSISMENDIYVRKHIHEFSTVEEPVSKQVSTENKPKLSNNLQKKRHRNKKIRKVRDSDNAKHNSKSKHDSKKVISNREKYEPTLNESRDSISETHTDLRKGKNKKHGNSGDIFNPDDADSQKLENQDEKEILESCEELSKENNLLKKQRLPFYVSSTTKRIIKNIFTKHPKKPVPQKDEMETDILLDDLNSVLGGNGDFKNIDVNTTINRLASSKILDLITDRVADKMLKKLEKVLASKDLERRTEMNLKKVEQFDILFQKDGDMVMMGRERIKEKEDEENDTSEAFYSQ